MRLKRTSHRSSNYRLLSFIGFNMVNREVNYLSLDERNPYHNPHDDEDPDGTIDHEDTPRNSGIMIHIVPETTRWNHIEDLDSFFTRMYNYHQKHGFTVIVLDEIFQLFEFGFVVWLLTFTIHCINHSILFGNTQPKTNHTKVTISDVIKSSGECIEDFGATTYFILLLATLYFIIRLIKSIYHITQYADIRKFYKTALHIDDNELDNITWHEVKRKIREVQSEHHMCIDKEQLTDLDIYHRILRFKNYMVALMNKNLLPVRYCVPFFGEVACLSRGLLYNINFILFRGPGSPFQNNWQLREDYTVRGNQADLAKRLSKLIMWVALANFILSPVIFIWQIIYFSFAYANILRKEPGALGMRTWSNYGRLYLRHFNELDHELDARLNRAYEYADRYMGSFSSPLMVVIAKNLLFLSGGLLVLILALGIYDEFVFQVEHILTIITALSVVGLVCRTLIPDENLIWCPEQLMTAILAHVHYLPSDWKSEAHTIRVRKEFGNFFQFKAGYLLNEICSPLTTPFVLIFVFRPKASEIVKFFRSFTVTVKGVGNVCSFAQMDVRKHGNRDWQLPHSVFAAPAVEDDNKKLYSGENGKTELSLIRFTLTNPEWQMPLDALSFLKGIRENAVQDLEKAKATAPAEEPASNAMAESLMSFGTIGNEYSTIATSVFNANKLWLNDKQASLQKSFRIPYPTAVRPGMHQSADGSGFEHMLHKNLGEASREPISGDELPSSSQYQAMTKSFMSRPLENMRQMRACKTEGSLEGPTEALLYSLSAIDPNSVRNPVNITVADMCLSTLYLHELHKQNMKAKQISLRQPIRGRTAQTVITSKAAENTPLLGNIRS